MACTRTATKALAAKNRRQRIVVSDEPEDPDIPDLVPRARLSMAGRAQEKLAEKLARRQLKDAQKKGVQSETSGLEANVVDPNTRKRPRVQIPIPPPQDKPEGHGPPKGVSSSSHQGDRGKRESTLL
ncbi:hypothetical protein SESBI_45770 [Sesbania bispinosa]|nr:hypothetical protein SESBI_45770 [Sesbania bispinosa]